MKFEHVSISSLKHLPKNARKHNDRNLGVIMKSLAECGQQKPIVVDADGVVIAGNGTLAAATKLGWKEIWVARTSLDKSRADLFAILDNRSAELAEWDAIELTECLDELERDGWELKEFGWDDREREKVRPKVSKEGLTDDDAVPENVETRCKPGDLWLLGSHRLLCGDSTDVLCAERLMGGATADFVYMDPPYGMNLNTNYAITPRVVGKTYAPVIGDDKEFDPRFWFEYFDKAREHFWWGADYYCQHLPKDGSWVVWDKKKDDLDESIGTGFELCWSKLPHKRMLARFLWSGFTAKERGETRAHPTQKPIALVEWFFDRWGKPKDNVVDLFLGSGSTLIACEKTNRTCYGMEIDPHYCDVILKRWEDFTGKTATLINCDAILKRGEDFTGKTATLITGGVSDG